MNTPALDPRILAKLEAFARRRRKLIVIRGVAVALAMLLATMLLVAAADYFFVLPDEVRWSLSGAAYLAVLLAEWRTCWRLLAYAPGPKQLARLIEHAEPKLREDLLSAVELGATEDGRGLDSPQFRELLQQDVATRMAGLTVERLLPVHLVRRAMACAAAIVVAVIVLVAVSGLQLGTLMLRALIPGANLARVSKTQVEVIAPTPAETRVPFGDAVPLVVKLAGAPAREVWLETFAEKEGRQMVKLNPSGPDQFSGAIQVGREDLRYRLRAGDAITRKYLLEAAPRPYVVRFTKTYRLPAYTRIEPWTVTEEGGDLAALEETEVHLSLEVDQPIKAAELRVEQGKDTLVRSLQIERDGRLAGTVRLAASGTYRVHLVAAKTGFENKFSPEFELRADPDLVPKVELVEPKGDLLLPANDLVDLVGEVSDDQTIARIEQHFRINEGPWQQEILAGESGKEKKIARRWDLYAQGTRPGDLLTTKFVAFDLKGNRGESRSLQITVTAAGMEMKRTESIAALLALHESLKLWRQNIEALGRATSEARQRFEQTSENDPQRQAALAGVTAARAEFERQHGETATALAAALRSAPAGHQGADLVVLGRQVGRVENGMLRSAKGLLALVGTDPAAGTARPSLREADDASNRGMQRARAVEEGFRVLLNGEEADLLAENTQILRLEQTRLADLARSSGDDRVRWEALGARVRVVLAETRNLEAILQRLAERGLGGDRGRNLARDLKKQRETVELALQESGVTKELLKPVVQLAEGIAKAERGALELRAELERRPLQVVHDFRQDAQPSWSALNRLPGELERLGGNKTLSPERLADLQAMRWEATRDVLKVYGDLEEIRPASDAAFVGELRGATQALEGLRVLVTEGGLKPMRERLAVFDRTFRLLEGAHDLQEILEGLHALAAEERWQVATPRARTAAPRDWGWLDLRLRKMPEELGKLDQKDEPVRRAIEEVRRLLGALLGQPACREIEHEMNERRKPDRAALSTRRAAETLAGEVRRALELLRPHVDAARERLLQIAPKLNEVAQALAKKAAELQEEVRRQQEQAKEKPEEEVRREAAAALARQEQFNAKVDALKDLLRADANQQDVLEAAQRERARDADDALALLKEPPPTAADALKAAAEAAAKPAQEQALAQAAEQQQKLTEALEQISQHYEALERGQDVQDSRTALRAKEEELGIKQELDQQYAKSERMAQLAKSTPQEMLQQLERALPNNPLMQQELGAITQNTLSEAHRKLEAASQAEKRLAEEVGQMAQREYATAQAPNAAAPPANPPAENPKLAQAAEQQAALAETTAEAGAEVGRSGRHEERLQNKSPSQRLQELGREIAETAKEKLPAARQALSEAQHATQAQRPLSAASQDLANETAQLGRLTGRAEPMPAEPDLPRPAPTQMSAAQMQAAQQMRPGSSPAQADPPQPSAPASSTPSKPAASGEAARPDPMTLAATPQEQTWMARTLDALDAALHADPNAASGQPQPAPGQPGQPQPAQDAQNGQAQQTPQNQPGQPGQPGQQAQQTPQQPQAGQNAPQQPSMAQAQQAMQQATQAAQQAMRQARSQNVAPAPQNLAPKSEMQAKSEQGSQAQMQAQGYGALPDAKNLRPGDWGKLPKQMAEQLSRGQSEAVSAEYRSQVETYYRVIGERAKKP